MFQRPDSFIFALVAVTLIGIGFIGGRVTEPPPPPAIDLETARAYHPPEIGGRLDPDYKDLVISALQHAIDSAAREGAAAQLRPRVPPCRVDTDCDPLPGGAP